LADQNDPDDAAMRARLDKLSGDLDARRAAENAQTRKTEARQQQLDGGLGRGMSMAMRVVSELIAGIAVGGAIGYGLDSVFHTKPLFLILLGLVGTAGGFWNIIRETTPKGRAAAVDFSDRLEAKRPRSEQGE
jgi:ATP synthase protein I